MKKKERHLYRKFNMHSNIIVYLALLGCWFFELYQFYYDNSVLFYSSSSSSKIPILPAIITVIAISAFYIVLYKKNRYIGNYANLLLSAVTLYQLIPSIPIYISQPFNGQLGCCVWIALLTMLYALCTYIIGLLRHRYKINRIKKKINHDIHNRLIKK